MQKDKGKSRLRNSKGEIIKEYTSQLKRSRVVQTYKNSVLRSELRRDPDSAQYLTRRDHLLSDTGFATNRSRAGVESRLVHICDEDRSVRKRLLGFHW